MAGILIIAHAPFATALRDCVKHIYGALPARIGAIDVSPEDDPLKLVEAARAEMARIKEDNGLLVLTDIFGATPANIAGQLATLPDVRVIAGVNLPMLVRAVCYRSTPLDVLVDKAQSGGAKGIQPVVPGATTCCGVDPCSASRLSASATSAVNSTSSVCEPHAAKRYHHHQ